MQGQYQALASGVLAYCPAAWSMAEARSHDEVEAIETPIGYIPKYDDLKKIFKAYLDKDYSEADYITQFSIRIPKLIAKLDRTENNFKEEKSVPQFFWDLLKEQRDNLKELMAKKGKDDISPKDL